MEIGGWCPGPIIGRGASATVSLATSLSSGRLFAVKSSDLPRSGALQREQRVLSALNSPFVVSYFGFDVGPHAPGLGLFYNLFMEYAPGGSLADEIKMRGGRLDQLAIRSYAHDILSGLAYLHSDGVVHCDLKSQNVLLCSGGRAKIADFGCARRRANLEDERDGARLQSRGTPMFMAPEVARGEEQGAPADVWALGCTVIEMATGRPPWPNVSDPVGALHRIAFSADVPELPSWISGEGKDFLSRCLRRDPRERWTAEQLLEHPFVASCSGNPRPKCDKDYDWGSPRSTLDQALWESLSDEAVEQPPEDPSGRMQSLIGGGAPNWTWDDKWVTVRIDGGQECSDSPAKDSTTDSVTSSGTEQLVFSSDHMDTEHVLDSSWDHSSLDDDCNADVHVGEGIENRIFSCKVQVNFRNDNFYLVIHKERIESSNWLCIFYLSLVNHACFLNAKFQVSGHWEIN